MFASGYRNFPTGALAAVGTDGDYWSSAPQSGSTNAGNLGFNSGIVNPLNSNNRAFGFTVRCVQHLQGCFFCIRFLRHSNGVRFVSSPAVHPDSSFGPEWRGR
ncbi:MAG: hypothetical protein K2G66_02635 [Alistipes sp.]|nr:hypothetical protein [Alistipes sp.]